MKQSLKQIGISLIIVLILTGLFVGMGTLSALVPHEAIADNIRASADQMPANEIREFLIPEEELVEELD